MENSEMSEDKADGEKSPSVSRSRLRKEVSGDIRDRMLNVILKHRNQTGRAERKRWSQPMQQKSRNATMKSQKLMKNQWKIFGKRSKSRRKGNRR